MRRAVASTSTSTSWSASASSTRRRTHATTSTRSESSRTLRKPARPLLVAEDDDVLAGVEHEVEVAARDRLLRPPAVDDAPLLAQKRDRLTVDEPRHARTRRDDERGSRLVQSSRGTKSARASGIRDHGATST